MPTVCQALGPGTRPAPGSPQLHMGGLDVNVNWLPHSLALLNPGPHPTPRDGDQLGLGRDAGICILTDDPGPWVIQPWRAGGRVDLEALPHPPRPRTLLEDWSDPGAAF